MQENKITSSVITHKLRDNPHVIVEAQVKVQLQMTADLQTLKITVFEEDRKAQWELSHDSSKQPF